MNSVPTNATTLARRPVPAGRFCGTLRNVTYGILIASALFAAGCASAPVKKESPVVYPAPPELPRLQFLTSFNGLKGVEEQSKFNRFIVGEQPDIKINKPYGIGMHDGKIYVCDTNATVFVIDLKARKFGTLKGATGAGRLSQPLNISITADGTKYVTDPVRAQVVVYDRNDEYVRAYGSTTKWRPVDAVAIEDRLYVADGDGRVVRVFDLKSGDAVGTIGDQGDPKDRLDRPMNLAAGPDGTLYVTDIGRFQVLKFDRDGKLLAAIGGPGDNRGRFARPKGIAVDRQNRLYTVDAAFNNVQIFNGDGRLLLFFGESGDKPGGFLLPAKVAIDYDNAQYFQDLAQPGFKIEYVVLVTSQFGSRLVNVLAYGRQEGQAYPSDDDLKRSIEEKRRQSAPSESK